MEKKKTILDEMMWDNFRDGELCIHCPNRESIIAFLEECKTRGFQWCSGDDADAFLPGDENCFIAKSAHGLIWRDDKNSERCVTYDISDPAIADSGNRRKFETGAVRDMAEGKGRCDLMPLDVAAVLLDSADEPDGVLLHIHDFKRTGDAANLYGAIDQFRNGWGADTETMILELAQHFENGAKKYGENNWQKGIPASCYIDSAVRHYLQYSRGDGDERHDLAFVWNLVCCIWTCRHKPELNAYGKGGETA